MSRTDLIYKTPVSQEDEVEYPQWMASLLKSIEVDQTPLSDVFMSSLQQYCVIAWYSLVVWTFLGNIVMGVL